MARSTGIKRDLRLDQLDTYANYYYLNFRGFLGQKGDSYDRFLIRMNEMAESLNIIGQVINKITRFNKPKLMTDDLQKKSENKVSNYSNILPHSILKYLEPREYNYNNYKNEYISMEQLIKHFKY
jgi:NADH:ubiquinone oxidoreductase subunit D